MSTFWLFLVTSCCSVMHTMKTIWNLFRGCMVHLLCKFYILKFTNSSLWIGSSCVQNSHRTMHHLSRESRIAIPHAIENTLAILLYRLYSEWACCGIIFRFSRTVLLNLIRIFRWDVAPPIGMAQLLFSPRFPSYFCIAFSYQLLAH